MRPILKPGALKRNHVHFAAEKPSQQHRVGLPKAALRPRQIDMPRRDEGSRTYRTSAYQDAQAPTECRRGTFPWGRLQNLMSCRLTYARAEFVGCPWPNAQHSEAGERPSSVGRRHLSARGLTNRPNGLIVFIFHWRYV